MALVKCPECGGQASDSASSCPHCGFPLAEYLEKKRGEDYIEYLKNKIKPVDFQCPPPRVKVCIKCGASFYYSTNINHRSHGMPLCGCGLPGVEVDYPEQGHHGYIDADLYILQHDIIPRNIGDRDSKEYKKMTREIEKQNEYEISEGRPPLVPRPPDPKDFGVYASTAPLPKPIYIEPTPEPRLPHCPFCSSTDLTKISGLGKVLKVWAFGLYGMDDTGKTYKCNNCGGKF